MTGPPPDPPRAGRAAKPVTLLLQVTRCYNYALFAFVVTAIAYRAAGRAWDARMLPSGLAPFLAVAAGYVFNDLEDAAEDRLDPYKRQKNVIAAGRLSRRQAGVLAASLAAASLALAAWLGMGSLLPVAAALLALFLYSWRRVRLRNHPVTDVAAHGGVFGLAFLAAFLPNWAGGLNQDALLVTAALTVAGALALVHHQQLDVDLDRAAGTRTTTVALGKRRALCLAYGPLLTALVVLVALLFASGFVPVAAVAAFVGVAGGILIPTFLTARRWGSRAWIDWLQTFAFNAGGAAAIVVWLCFY